MNKRLEVPGKRVLLFTKVILTLLLISVLIFLNYIDLQESNSNRRYLATLNDAYQLGVNGQLQFQDYELERIDWLHRSNLKLQQSHTKSRVALVDLLNRFGASIGQSTKGGGNNPNSIVLMVNSSFTQKTTEQLSKKQRSEVVAGRDGKINTYSATVKMALDTFRQYQEPDTVSLLTGIDTTVLSQRLDSILNLFLNSEVKTSYVPANVNVPFTRPGVRYTNKYVEGEVDMGTGGPGPHDAYTEKERLLKNFVTFGGLFIYHDSINIILESHEAFGQTQGYSLPPSIFVSHDYRHSGAQGSPPPTPAYLLKLPAQIDSAIFPCILQLAGTDSTNVRELANNKSKQKELQNLYGAYALNFIDNLSAETFAENNKAVSILGFDISRKWFPIAMFLVLLFIYVMLHQTISNAKKQSLKILSGHESEETLDFLIDIKLIRFSTWVITPLVLLFLILYSTLIHYSTAIYAGITVCGVSSFLLGWLSYKKSLQL